MISASSDRSEADLIHLLRQVFESDPDVRSALFARTASSWNVVIFVEHNDPSLRQTIYEQAEQLRRAVGDPEIDVAIILAGEPPPALAANQGWTVAFNRG